MNASFLKENQIKFELEFKELTSPIKITYTNNTIFNEFTDELLVKIESIRNILIEYNKCQFDYIRSENYVEISFYLQERELECLFNTLPIRPYFSPNMNISIIINALRLSIYDANSAIFALSCNCNREYIERRKQFEILMDCFYSEVSVNPIECLDENLKSNYNEIFNKVLNEYNGICIGEDSHSHSFGKALIIENMSQFKNLGVKTLYLEHLFYDTMNTLSDFESPIPLHIKDYLKSLSSGFHLKTKYDFLALVNKSREMGMRIVPIDTSLSYSMGADRKLGIVDIAKRISAMNFIAKQIIENDQKDHPGKYLVFLGAAHLSKYKPHFPGVSELLGIPSILTLENKIKSILKNISSFKLGHSDYEYLTPVTYCFSGNIRSVVEENNVTPILQHEESGLEEQDLSKERKMRKINKKNRNESVPQPARKLPHYSV